MRFDDQVLSRFADANPVPDEATLDALLRPDLELIYGEEAMSDTQQRPINTDRPIVKQERSRGLIYGLAAAAVALLIGTVSWIALAGSEDPTLEELAAGGDPIAVIEVFHQKWSEGDVEGALQYVAPSNSLVGRAGIEYVIAVEPAGWSWSVTDCAEQVPGTYRCRVAMIGDPVIDILAPGGRTVQFIVEGSSIARVGFADYQQEDQMLAAYAERQDPDGYATVCTIRAADRDDEPGFYNKECGAFLSQYVTPLAAELNAP